MKWYFGLSEASINRSDHGWRGLIRVAVASARANTTLHPHMLYDGAENDFTAELRGLGVTVIHHRVSFSGALNRLGQQGSAVARGAFLRLEIPLIELEDPFVLYTDCDVIFRDDPPLHSKPAIFSAAPQTSQTDTADMNSGIMLMNVRRMREDLPRLTSFITAKLEADQPGLDQEAYREFYAGQWDTLPLVMNWKPYWGWNPAATIVHWHGPKPVAIRKLLCEPATKSHRTWLQLFENNPEGYRAWLAEWDRYAAMTRREITGHIDWLDANKLSGWALINDDNLRPLVFRIEIDGHVVSTIECNACRPDLVRIFNANVGGFYAELPTLREEQRLRLLVGDEACRLYWRGELASEFSIKSRQISRPHYTIPERGHPLENITVRDISVHPVHEPQTVSANPVFADFYFDEEWYIRRYPDVAKAIQNNPGYTGRLHYLKHGRGEGRLPVAPVQTVEDCRNP